jgi:hypothetical protein
MRENGLLSQNSMYLIDQTQCQNLISIKTKRHKSLGVLTLIFINLFLKKGPLMSLEEAAENIFEEADDGQTIFKSKVSPLALLITSR